MHKFMNVPGRGQARELGCEGCERQAVAANVRGRGEAGGQPPGLSS